MSSKYGNIWIWFVLVLDIIFVAMMIILFKFKVVSVTWFFVILIFLITAFLVLLLTQIIGIFNYSEEKAVESQKRPTSKMFQIRSRINQFLKERPNGDSINWDGGRYGREEIRSFSSPNGGNKEFYGVAAMLGHSRKWVVIIYSIEKNDIIKYVGDPGPDLLADPFFGFKYFDDGRRGGFGFGRDDGYYDDRYGRGAVNVNFGGRSEERRREGERRAVDGVDKAFDALKRSG